MEPFFVIILYLIAARLFGIFSQFYDIDMSQIKQDEIIRIILSNSLKIVLFVHVPHASNELVFIMDKEIKNALVYGLEPF